ncbi:unnamed protein product [Protopolystoma xenopodis]|uniref:Uncharacterized protein n=1 Tax=Protopolystoma xenopodis TaxID=117903 RepID=A0A448WKB4_9PLAT|nr:unnamed protein product [Protopolystoma xenopodis]
MWKHNQPHTCRSNCISPPGNHTSNTIGAAAHFVFSSLRFAQGCGPMPPGAKAVGHPKRVQSAPKVGRIEVETTRGPLLLYVPLSFQSNVKTCIRKAVIPFPPPRYPPDRVVWRPVRGSWGF